jgi:hypothetical protein
MLTWKREEGEREKVGYKLIAGLRTTTKKVCERDKWAVY